MDELHTLSLSLPLSGQNLGDDGQWWGRESKQQWLLVVPLWLGQVGLLVASFSWGYGCWSKVVSI